MLEMVLWAFIIVEVIEGEVESVDVRVVDFGGITELEVRSHTPNTHNDTKTIVVIVDE